MASFLFGACGALLKDSKWLKQRMENKIFAVVYFLISFYFASVNLNMSGIYKPLQVLSNYNVIVRSLGVALLVIGSSHSVFVQRIGNFSILAYLGEISMYIYAIHIPILFVVAIRLWNFNLGGEYLKYILVYLSSFAVTVCFAIIWNCCSKGVNLLIHKKKPINNI